jgi:hypothetical protein
MPLELKWDKKIDGKMLKNVELQCFMKIHLPSMPPPDVAALRNVMFLYGNGIHHARPTKQRSDWITA